MTLNIEKIVKSFGENHVLKGISFEAKTGSAFGLLGRNGAGKTTTMRIIMGVFPADDGRIFINGNPISKSKTRFGYLPEERGLYPKRLIGEQLEYLGRLRGLTKPEAAESSLKWLSRLGMRDTLNTQLLTLSKGNQQKIQLAAALLGDPDIIILDEPFSGLDPVNAQLLKDLVTELIESGKIVLFSSHQMSYVEQFCDSIAILHEGTIVLNGDLRTIKRGYERTKIFLSTEESDTSLFKQLDESITADHPAFIENYIKLEGGVMIKIVSEADRGALLSFLLSKNITPERFEVIEPSLQDIFIEKAGGGDIGEVF